MSRLRVVVLLWLVAAPLAAQSIESLVADSIRLARARVRVDSVRQQREESRRRQFSGPSVSDGLITIFVDAPLAAVAHRGAALASARIHEINGDAYDAFIRTLKFRIDADTSTERGTLYQRLRRVDVAHKYRLSVQQAEGNDELFLGVSPDASIVSQQIERAVRDAYQRHMDSNFGKFAVGTPWQPKIPVEWWRDQQRAIAMGSAIGRRCVQGDLQACKIGMGLIPTADPLGEWYDAADYPRVIKNLWSGDQSAISARAGSQTFDACTNGNGAACQQLLPLVDVRHLTPPMAGMGPSVLVRLAFAMGGREGIARLDSARGAAIPAQVAALAGRPFDDVLREWQRRLASARSTGNSPAGAPMVAAVGWIVVMLGFSLRGTPWRS